MTVAENVAYPLRLRGMSSREVKQRVKGRGTQHMHFVYDIELCIPYRRSEVRSLDYLADIVYTCVGCCVNLNQVGGDLAARRGPGGIDSLRDLPG